MIGVESAVQHDKRRAMCRAPARTSICLTIAGLTFQIRSFDWEFLTEVSAAYGSFVTASEADLVIDMETTEDLLIPARPGVSARHIGDELTLYREDFHGRVDLQRGCAELVQRRTLYSLDAFLRVVMSVLLAKAGGILVHAASVVRSGKGYLFFGPSGSGKSTIASLACGGLVMGDELSAVRRIEGAYVICGTPFLSEHSCDGGNGNGHLHEMYRISHAPDNHRELLEPAAAFQSLLPETVVFGGNSGLIEQVADNCIGLTQEIDCYELHFLPEPSLWEVVGC